MVPYKETLQGPAAFACGCTYDECREHGCRARRLFYGQSDRVTDHRPAQSLVGNIFLPSQPRPLVHGDLTLDVMT